jgi:Bacterial Ig-like domain (group 3)
LLASSVSAVLAQKVSKSASSTTVVSSANPSSYGQGVTFTATVTTGATGTVTFKSGPTTLGIVALTGNSASLSTSALTRGTQNITAVYSGDANYNASTSPVLKQVVNKALTAESLGSSQNPSTAGQPVTFTATVTSSAGVPTGTVTFKRGATTLGSVPLSGGVAALTISTLPVGSGTITASYGGTGNYATSSASVTQVVQ